MVRDSRHGWRRVSRREPTAGTTDRLPTCQELLDVIGWQARIIDLVASDRNRLAADLAELLCRGAAA